MVVKTFRGILTDTQEQRIKLSTIQGKVGYQIIKFEVIPEKPGAQEYEATVTISKVTFTPSNDINFSDDNILAVAYWAGHDGTTYPQTGKVIVFDREVFNQDIFIGNNDLQSHSMNYYLELEVIPLSEQGAEYTTVKDLRSNTATVPA